MLSYEWFSCVQISLVSRAEFQPFRGRVLLADMHLAPSQNMISNATSEIAFT